MFPYLRLLVALVAAILTISTQALCQDILYGVTRFGGQYNKGVPYQIRVPGNDYLSYKDFDGSPADRPGYWSRLTQLMPIPPPFSVGNSFVGLTEYGSIATSGADVGSRFDFMAGTAGTFQRAPFYFGGEAGTNPTGGLVAAFGKLYGTIANGGDKGDGALFAAQGFAGNGQQFQAYFDGPVTGSSPKGTPVVGPNGVLYGTTEFGGASNAGVVYGFGPNGLYKVLDFNGPARGANPTGDLVVASDNRLYGMTSNGGSTGNGVIFSVALDGSDFRKLMDFNGANGAHPAGSLVEFSDGKLYGMTRTGGAANRGTVFSITRQGQYTKIADLNGPNGQNPYGDLLVDPRGLTLYGVTYSGGANNVGVLFKVAGGVYTKLFDFDARTGSNPVGTLSMVRKMPIVKVAELTTVELSKGAFMLPVEATGSKVLFLSDDLSTLEVIDGQLVPKKTGGVRIKVFQLGNAEYMPSYREVFVNVIKSRQTVEFLPLPDKTYLDPSFELTATATSGLPVSFYSSNPDVATVDDRVVTIRNAGITYLTTMQPGDDIFEPAEVVTQTLFVKKIDQTISVQPVPSQMCCYTFPLSASSTSGLALTFEGDRTKLIVNQNLITPISTGKFEVRVYHPGDRNHNAAEAVVDVEIVKGTPILDLIIPSEATFGTGPYYAYIASNGEPVTFTSEPAGIAVVENQRLYLLGVGTTTITASQRQSDRYLTAPSVSRTITVKPPLVAPTGNVIAWSDFRSTTTLADPPFNLTASASSGLPVTYTSSDPTVATVVGNQVILRSVGTATLTASQAGTATVPAAADVSRTITVGIREQYLSINLNSYTTVDTYPIALPTTTSEGLPVTYEVSDPGMATIENYNLLLKAPGFLTVTGSHPGNEKYLPISSSETTYVSPGYYPVSVAALPRLTYGDDPVELKIYSPLTLPVVVSTSDPDVAEVVDGKLVIRNAGQFTLSASLNSPAYYSEASYYLEVHKATQQLTVAPVSDKRFGDTPFRLQASSTSGLPVNAVPLTPGVVSISNNVVTIIGSGVASIQLQQPGNNNYAASTRSIEFAVADAGNRYEITGTSLEGAAGNSGAVYAMETDAGTVDYIKQYPERTAPSPTAGFIKASDGKFYGLFRQGGIENGGQLVVMTSDFTGATAVHEFKRQTGYTPAGNLFEGADGFLYGATTRGGKNNSGSIFKVSKDGSAFSVLYDFSSLSGQESGGVIQAANGRLYGTTAWGGPIGQGTLYSLKTDGTDFRILYHFAVTSVASISFISSGELVQGPDGALYGTIMYGGADSNGTLYKINTDGTGFTVLRDFNDAGTGIRPAGRVLFASDGRIYGTTAGGGVSGVGTIYSLLPSGAGFTQVHSFNGSNGTSPMGALTEGSDGRLYGTTYMGGALDNGTIFGLAKNGSGFTKLFDLDPRATHPRFGPLVESEPGVFFGTAEHGGALNAGAVFKVTTSGAFEIFCHCRQGEFGPRELIEDPTGTYWYGVTRAAEWNQAGSIFRIRKDNRAYEKIVDVPEGEVISTIFYASTGHLWVAGHRGYANFIYRINPDGTNPQPISTADDLTNQQGSPTSFVELDNGTIFGASPWGHSGPMLFSIRNDGTGYRKLQNLSYDFMQHKLLLASDGNVYLASGETSILRITPDGTVSEIFSRDPSTGNRVTKVFEMNDGRLGFTTSSSSSYARPTIFSIEKDGTGFVKILEPEDGSPADIEQSFDGWLYALSSVGGEHGKGIFYRVRPDGSSYQAIRHLDGLELANPENFMFNKSAQTLLFSAIPDKQVNAPDFYPDITTSSGAAVVLSSSNPEVASIQDGLITLHKKGSTVITARLPANANFYDGGTASQPLLVTRGDQTITFTPPEDKLVTAPDFELSAFSSSGLALTFVSSNPAVASIEGTTVRIHAAGSVTITASQPGNEDYFAAASVSHTLTIIPLKDQAITFTQPSDKTFGNPSFTLVASATSGLPVSFTSTSNNIILDGNRVQVLSPGQVIIVASQDGGGDYGAAAPVTRSFCINPSTPNITEEGALSEIQLVSSSDVGNQWFFANETIPGSTAFMITPRKQGSYAVQVTIGGCRSELSAAHLVIITAVEEWGAEVDVYPNPVAEKLTVNLGSELTDVKLSLTTAAGVPVSTFLVNAGGCEIDMSQLPSGMYLLQIEHDGKVNRYKVLRK